MTDGVIDTSSLAPGNHTVEVSYPGNDTVAPYEFSTVISVDKAVPVVSAKNVTFVVGDEGVLEITGPANGNLIVSINGTNYAVALDATGNAALDVSGLAEGTYPVDITYIADDYYKTTDFMGAATVNVAPKAVLYTEISVVAESINVGDVAVVNVSVITPSSINGQNISITVNGKTQTVTVKDAKASAEFADLPVGEYEVTAVYAGDDTHAGASDITILTVSKAVGETSIDVSDITVGDDAVITVNVPSDASGVVLFDVDGKNYYAPIKDGKATLVLSDLPEDNYTVTYTFPGDDKYANATGEGEFEVSLNDSYAIEAESGAVQVGDDATIMVTLPEDATGEVTVTVDGKDYVAPVEDGKASVSVPGLSAGNYTADVAYSGDDKYAPKSTSAGISVDKIADVAMNVSADPVKAGENATIMVTLPEDATGNVSVTVGNETYTVPVVNGTASVSIPALDEGNYTAVVTYSGVDKYGSVSSNVSVDVENGVIISAPDVTKYFKGSERFIVNVTDYQGNPIANKSVVININGVDYTRTTDDSGVASLAINLGAGVFNVTTAVDNITVNSVVTVLTTVNGTDLTKVFRNESQYYVTLRDSEGNYLAEGSQVQFNINGVMYYRSVSGNEGLAKLNINLNTGEYIITAINLVTGEMSSDVINVLPRLVENMDVTKYFRNATQYSVRVIGDDGNPVGAGEVVTFNIHGVFYNRTTDENGYVVLNINLGPGNYIVTAMYKGFMVSNNITVLPVLTASDLTKTYGTSDQFVAHLVDGQGNPYSGQSINFNINGVFYDRTTDADGNAKLNINLGSGEYIITSKYGDAVIGNTIKVNA